MSPIPQVTYWKAQLPYGSEKKLVCDKNAAEAVGQDVQESLKTSKKVYVLK